MALKSANFFSNYVFLAVAVVVAKASYLSSHDKHFIVIVYLRLSERLEKSKRICGTASARE